MAAIINFFFSIITTGIVGAISAAILWGLYVLVRLAIRRPAPRRGVKFFFIAFGVFWVLTIISVLIN